MSARTKRRLTKRNVSTKKAPSENLIPWREVFQQEIEKYGEGGLALRGSRRKEGITQKELAAAIGISQHHISEMENGKRPIGREMAKKLGLFFKADFRVFL